MACCTLLLSGAILFQFYNRYDRSRHNVADIEQFRVVLDAATALAAERGPANSAMGEADAGMKARIEALASAREKTDLGIAAIEALEAVSSKHMIPASLIDSMKRQLLRARRTVDAAINKPRAQRSFADIQSAIEAMIATSDMMDDGVRWMSESLVAEDPELSNPVISGQILSHLRDYTGRIASHIMAAVIAREPIPLQNQIESRLSRGRVMELWRLLSIARAAYPANPDIAEKQRIFEEAFFGPGLRLIDRTIAEGNGRANYRQTSGELSRDFVATIKPVEEVRKAFLQASIDDLRKKERHAWYMLVAVSWGAAVITLFLIGLAAAVQAYLFGPLLRASAMVIDLADGRIPEKSPRRPKGAELNRLFEALSVLTDRMVERAALMSRLQTEAETDGMTGLLNRAAFERLMRTAEALQGTCLILIDIDHFKSINDRFGHPAGDNVLRSIAALLKVLPAMGHVPARFGGEEFAILFRGDLSSATALCDGLRVEIAALAVEFDGVPLPGITASFGLTAHREDRFEDIVRRADAALYRAKGEGRNRVCIAH
ncbi:GGDEF domain-containing protein [Gellertiella hungarica]|uniref:diguanylate cyclase n=1 Tax=Gellertiella hungarica TaxID=1572859 RepID=A0A7W6J9F5_9HYPH|nr:GGDEF domain-containing protein [Gellertiella hungarica]MBB4066318.1 diguanylate cyclase (GGDEF)-like protein [Gellertiella hungarica]